MDSVSGFLRIDSLPWQQNTWGRRFSYLITTPERPAFLPPHAGGAPIVQHITNTTATTATYRRQAGVTAPRAEASTAEQAVVFSQEARVPGHAASSWLKGPLRDCALSSNDNGALARKLLDAGASTDDKDRFGRRPLHWAALRGNLVVCLALLDAGADVSARDKAGKTPLHHAKDAIIVEALLDRRRQLRQDLSAHPASPQAHGAVIDEPDWSFIVDAQNSYGSTALHRAAFHGREDCLLALLSGAANVTVVGKSGRSALHLACRNAHAGCVKVLLGWGADESAKAFDGATPWSELAIAAEELGFEHPRVVETGRLLNEARATGAWGRRGWLVMLMETRSRSLDGNLGSRMALQSSEDIESEPSENGWMPINRRMSQGGAAHSWDLEQVGEKDGLRHCVFRLLDIGEAGCIRHVVSFM